MADRQYRSLIKAASWRALGTLDTVVISFFITGKISMAISIGGVELFTKLLLYYLHERIWNKIPLGRYAPPAQEYEI